MDRWDTIHYTACEIDKVSARVALSQHPEIKQLGDLKRVTEAQLTRFANRVGPSDDVLYVAGFPCQDNSILKGKERKGLRGPKSGLVWNILGLRGRPRAKLKARCPSVQVQTGLENVTGTSKSDRVRASERTMCALPLPC